MPAMVTLDQERGIRITSAVGPMRWADFLEIYRMIAGDPSLATVEIHGQAAVIRADNCLVSIVTPC